MWQPLQNRLSFWTKSKLLAPTKAPTTPMTASPPKKTSLPRPVLRGPPHLAAERPEQSEQDQGDDRAQDDAAPHDPGRPLEDPLDDDDHRVGHDDLGDDRVGLLQGAATRRRPRPSEVAGVESSQPTEIGGAISTDSCAAHVARA